MLKLYLLPALALLGLIFVVRTVILGSLPKPVQPPVVQPAHSSFTKFVAGSGIIESSSENISIASPLAGVVSDVHVKVGDSVLKNAPLFTLDLRELTAEKAVRAAQLESAKAQLNDTQTQLSIYKTVEDSRAVAKGELLRRQSAVSVATAKVAEAHTMLEATQTTLERMIVRSPIAATILQVKIRPGEFAPAQALTTPLMLLGNTETLTVRTDVDENDAWRVQSGASARGILRGNTAISFSLTFVRFEPYVIPKRSLTGDSTERVDTRVLQVLFSLQRSELPLFVGQLVDVFIEEK